MAKKQSETSTLKQALLGSLLFSILAMAPVLPHFASYKFGPNIGAVGSDSYGFLYSMWIYAQPVDGTIRTESQDLLSGFPIGRPIAKHIQLGSGISYQLAGLGVPPVAAYNLIIWLWFFLAYFFAFQIAKALKFSNGIAHLTAFVIGLHPYQTLQAVDHIDLAMTWPILLDILLLIRLVLYREAWAYPAIVALTGLSVFSHPYYLIFLSFINILPVLWFAMSLVTRKEKPTPKFIGFVVLSIAVCAGAVKFWKSLFTDGGPGMANVERNISDLYQYSTKIWDFILPPHYSALFARFTNEFKAEQTMATGSNFVENTLYPGALVLLACAFAIGYGLVHRKVARKWLTNNWGLIFLAVNLIAIPILFSISPSFNILGFEISTPTALVHKFLPQFRTMSRLGYVASIGLILVFAFVVQQRFNKSAVVWALGLLFVFDLGYFHRNFYSDTSKVPEVYSRVKDSTPKNAVIFEVPFMWGYLTTYWQSYHQRRNLATFDPGDPSFQSFAATANMDFPALINFARTNKVDYLILHSPQDLPLPFQKFENQTDDTWLFFLFARYSYLIPVAAVRN